MSRHAGAPGPDLRERLARERYLGYIACTRASEKLVVTFSRHDADGKTLNPSPFIAHLRRILPGLEVEEFQRRSETGRSGTRERIIVSLVEVQNLEGAGVTRLKSEDSQSLLTSSPTTR